MLSLIHISEPTRLGMISYAVFCLKKKNKEKLKGHELDSKLFNITLFRFATSFKKPK